MTWELGSAPPRCHAYQGTDVLGGASAFLLAADGLLEGAITFTTGGVAVVRMTPDVAALAHNLATKKAP